MEDPVVSPWGKITRFADVPTVRPCSRGASFGLREALEKVDSWVAGYGLDLDPDFQRGHVWTERQQTAWLEYLLLGGRSGATIYLNHPGWMTSFEGDFVLVDGKQRLETLRAFWEGRVRAFGSYLHEFEDQKRFNRMAEIVLAVHDLPTRGDVLRWYLGMNSGGSVHSAEEISRVAALLRKAGETEAVR